MRASPACSCYFQAQFADVKLCYGGLSIELKKDGLTSKKKSVVKL
jgi:hypothetical protein